MPRAKKVKAGKLSMEDMRKLINKKAGQNVAHDLTDENPTEVKQWIPTGSRQACRHSSRKSNRNCRP